MRHLRRILKTHSLYRRRYSNIEEAVRFIQRELDSSGKLHGYRWMWEKLHNKGLQVRKEDIRLILSCLDPEGVETGGIESCMQHIIIFFRIL